MTDTDNEFDVNDICTVDPVVFGVDDPLHEDAKTRVLLITDRDGDMRKVSGFDKEMWFNAGYLRPIKDGKLRMQCTMPEGATEEDALAFVEDLRDLMENLGFPRDVIQVESMEITDDGVDKEEPT